MVRVKHKSRPRQHDPIVALSLSLIPGSAVLKSVTNWISKGHLTQLDIYSMCKSPGNAKITESHTNYIYNNKW